MPFDSVVQELPVLWLIRFTMITMMPRAGGLPGIEDTHLNDFLQKMRREADPLFWSGLVLGAAVFMISPLFTIGLPVPALLLPKSLRYLHAERLLAHPVYLLRQAAFLVRVSAGMCWGADPDVRAHFALAPLPPDPGTFRSL